MNAAGEKLAGREVLIHCRIVGEIARELLGRLPASLRNELFPDGVELIAAAHDIGKVSPTFQEKIYRGAHEYKRNSKPGLENVNPEIERQWGGHAGVSQATARHLKLGKFIPEILGQHHGYSPDVRYLATDEVFGSLAWEQRREELLSSLKILLRTEFPVVVSELQARLLAGLTSVADWVGSGSLFDDPSEDWRPRIKQALDSAGFVQPLLKSKLQFAEIFGFQPNEIQKCFLRQVNQTGVYVLEAPMGLGKTEAALYAAYNLLATQQATGIYFALPTQLTSDKIHKRVGDFLGAILETDSSHQQPILLHGNAWLKTIELGKEGNPGGSWFQASKRGILAPFAVGTIDQALMAVMNVKHGFVRTFGLAGKVVILDEVHSYDSYTGTILTELVQALRQLKCTVIILSATLTRERREILVGSTSCRGDYPLITASPTNGVFTELETPKIADVSVDIRHCKQDGPAIEEALLRAEQGQQVLWVENTVAEAQAIYRLLAARECSPKIECGLLHSRFLKTDRENNEHRWIGIYGKNGDSYRRQSGRILVGTQVLEQSLDIDADFLITRFAPTDMLLQRIGRLWRHAETWRPTTAIREVWLLVPELTNAIESPAQAFGKTANVYSPYVLCRSLQVWQEPQQVVVPGNIRELIEATYIERAETGRLLGYLNELHNKRDLLQRLAQLGISTAGQTLPEEKASTRYSEQDNVDVLLIRTFQIDKQRGAVRLGFIDGSEISLPNKGKGLSQLQKRTLSAQLMQNTVQVAEHLAPKEILGNGLDWLQGYLYLGKANGENRLRVAKVQNDSSVAGLSDGVASDKYRIQYDRYLGYQADK